MIWKRTYALFLPILVVQVLAAQSPTLPLYQVLAQVEAHYGYAFSFDQQLIAGVTVPEPDLSLTMGDCLAQVLSQLELDYRIVGERDVILLPFQPQPTTLCGYVLDGATKVPLVFAHVYLPTLGTGAYTDEQGFFRFTANLPKVAPISITYLGYQEAKREARLFSGSGCPSIVLAPAGSELSTVTVRGFTIDMLESEQPGIIRFTPEKIPTLPGWGEPDILRSLQLLPGISTADESATNLNIRGGSPDQNLILWDGIPIYHAGHFFGFYGAVNPYVAKEVDVHRGGFGAEYGGRVSGVVDISGKPNFNPKGEYGLGLNLINAHGFAEIPLRPGKSALLVAMRRSYTDLFQSTTYRNIFSRVFSKGRLYDNQGLELETGGEADAAPNFYYSDFNLKWAAQPSDRLDMAISYFTSEDVLGYRFEWDDLLTTRDDLSIRNLGISAHINYEWAPGTRTKLQLTSSRFENNYNFDLQFEGDTVPTFDTQVFNKLEDAKIALHHNWQISPRHRLVLGVEVNAMQAGYDFSEDRQGRDISLENTDYTGSVPTLFGSYYYEAKDKLQLNVGFRAEGYDAQSSGQTLFETGTILPRYSIRYSPFEPDFYLQSSGGIYRQYVYQLPAFYNDLGAGEHIWVLANDDFPVLNAIHLSAGLGLRKPHFLMEIEPYGKIIDNQSSWNVELEEGEDTPLTQDGLLAALGIDVLIKREWDKYSIWTAYTMGVATYRYEALNRGDFFPADYDQLHRLNLTQTLTLKRWDVSAIFHLSSGRPYTEPTALGNRVNKGTGLREYYPVYSTQNNRRLPTYHRLDLAINYKIERQRMKGKIGLSLFNLYNQNNLSDIDFFLFPPEENQLVPRPISLERSMLQRTPNLFVQFSW